MTFVSTTHDGTTRAQRAAQSSRSAELYARACELMPAGVSSPVRAFKHVGGTPIYLREGRGARVTDVDGNRYVDFCLAWGPMILGHSHPEVVEAVVRATRDGLAFGTTHAHEVALAERILQAFPGKERVRFVVSGTEAVQTALRLARAKTGRKRILKFSGCYHGHSDAMLVKGGSGLVTQGIAESAGVIAAETTLVAPLGDEAAIEEAFAAHGETIAAVILEPLPANNGLLVQGRRWLESLRRLTRAHGALLVFDEVITGFRFGFSGYDRVSGVIPDLVTLGKIVGGGLPVAAVVGTAEVMDLLAPKGPVYQAGTMAGNPVALACGIATLDVLARGGVYERLETLGRLLDEETAGIDGTLIRRGSLFWPYFAPGAAPVRAEAIASEAVDRFRRAYAGFLAAGLYLPPSAYEVGFLSAAHDEDDVRSLARALVAASKAQA